MPANTSAVGKPIDRVDGRLKVTGRARYAAEAQLPGVAHGVLVLSEIAKGKVATIESTAAEHAPGVLAVITHRNAPKATLPDDAKGSVDPSVGTPLPPLQNDIVHYHGQPIAVVVADSFERAMQAAPLVRASYREEPATNDFAVDMNHAFAPKAPKGEKQRPDYQRGTPDQAIANSAVKVECTYTIPDEYHNPMELHATIAAWNGDRLTLHDKTQWVDNVQKQAAASFGLPKENVHVLSPFVGGAFGSALRAWPHVFIAALAAKVVRRPVKIMLTRAQMFTVTGYRPHTVQTIAVGADPNGKFLAIRHEGTAQTSTYEEYTESLVNATHYLYACPNVATRYRLAAMNVNTPASMRGPGEASGVFALECAIDELAVALKIDPVELRLRNHADIDPEKDLPWSSKSLKECYRDAGKRFGWDKRDPKPRSMRDGHTLIGWGMASATWPTFRRPATVMARLLADGSALIRTASHDIGPGTYTILTQIAADALGLAVANVRVEIGDSRFPTAPVEGGSMTAASVGSAVHEACTAVRTKLIGLACADPQSQLHGAAADGVVVQDGRLQRKEDAKRQESFVALLKRHGKNSIEVTHESKPGDAAKKYSMHAFGAHFVEVRVDPELATVRIGRVVSGFAAGRIINPKTAHSQAIGGIVGGIGMALLEEAVRDPRNGRFINSNLADYRVPVHADIPHLEAFFVDEVDHHASAIGVKGLAELSLVGVAAAVANAVYHATGRRIRDLPTVPDKLL